jgi:alanine dehydrogenase
MIIGIPKEVKNSENRVGINPSGVVQLVNHQHKVLIETNAGTGSGISDADFRAAGAIIVNDAKEIFYEAEMIVKVKEPQPQEYSFFKEGQILFTFMHSVAEPEMVKSLLEQKVIGISYDTVQLSNGSLPILAPMSEVAGRMSVQVGAHFLEKTKGGKGILMGGIPGVPPAEVVVIGGGVVGTNAAKIAIGMGAVVTIVDVSLERLRYLDDMFGGRVQTVISNPYNIEQLVKKADLLIGAVLLPGTKAPQLVSEKMVSQMKVGSVIVDVAVDQGGCIETIDRVTTHSEPVYEKYGVIHYAVANMPGAVPRTSTFALTNVTIPYIMQIANEGLVNAIKHDLSLTRGVNIFRGFVTHETVALGLGYKYQPLKDIL